MKPLPTNLDQITGLKAARWTRSSTKGQADRNGPDAQHEQQDRVIERFGLVDTGLEWLIAHSGYRKDDKGIAALASTAQWADMMARAGRDFDVLIVGYVSRWARDAEVQFTARRLFHQAGAAILFADERLLSSDDSHWEQWAREAVEAESYSRRLGRRVSEGLASKRRRHGDPGGRPPYGFRRTVERIPVIEVDPSAMEIVHRAFELAAAGHSDHEIGAAIERKPKWVAEILTNPIYIGLLRDGNPSAVGPVIDMGTWQAVQSRREARRTREPGQVRRASPYALRIRCLGCGAQLFGDTGRYRHPKPVCAEFVAAAPDATGPMRGRHTRTLGHSYAQEWYEGLADVLLRRAGSAPDELVQAVLAAREADEVRVDEVALARIGRDRDDATRRLTETRDVTAWQARMTQLDAEEAAARTAVTGRLTDEEVAAYVRDLPSLWRDADTGGRKSLASALWSDVAALGWRTVRYTWSRHAIELGLGR